MNDFKFEEKEILRAADEMAAAATNFKGHGYDVFIEAREKLKELLAKIFEK